MNKELVKILNKHLINIIEKSGGQKRLTQPKIILQITINKLFNSYATHIETILAY